MTELFFLLSALIAAVVAFISFRPKTPAQPTNRYRKTKKSIRAQLTRSAQTYATMRPDLEKSGVKEKAAVTDAAHFTSPVAQNMHDTPDADDVLGLKSPNLRVERQSGSVHHQETQDFPVILYLMAPENCVYAGYELLQALLGAGLRYGKQRIFHRHVHKDGRGDILFHCTSAMAPGTFDLTKMGAFTSKGLCLFFVVGAVEDPLSTFDCLLETLDYLIDDLGGQVLDDHRDVLTKEKMVQYRHRIRAFAQRKTTTDLFS